MMSGRRMSSEVILYDWDSPFLVSLLLFESQVVAARRW